MLASDGVGTVHRRRITQDMGSVSRCRVASGVGPSWGVRVKRHASGVGGVQGFRHSRGVGVPFGGVRVGVSGVRVGGAGDVCDLGLRIYSTASFSRTSRLGFRACLSPCRSLQRGRAGDLTTSRTLTTRLSTTLDRPAYTGRHRSPFTGAPRSRSLEGIK